MRTGAGGIRAGLCMGFSHEPVVHIVGLGCLWREYFWQDDTPVGAGVNHA